MKQSEAVRIPELISARNPRPVVEEITLQGVRMLVILGDDVDTVIQYQPDGGAKMPQISTYEEVAESAARADELLAKQRASGRTNTTGEGAHWPRNWKLAKAKAAGKIWYAETQPTPRQNSFAGELAKSTASKIPSWPLTESDPCNFAIQFPRSEIGGLVARRLTNVKEDAAFAAGCRIAAGDLRRDNLKVIVGWKMEGVHLTRVMSYLAKNTDDEIIRVLRSAITAGSEGEAIQALDRLQGVGVPVASAILTTVDPARYTIIDIYALRSLGVEGGPTHSVDYYLLYLEKCRDLAREFGISLRVLDHALWQWGYEHRREKGRAS